MVAMKHMMKKIHVPSTTFLRISVWGIAAIAAALCIFIGIQVVREGVSPQYPMLWGIVITILLSAIPFFIALRQALRLLRAIDTGSAFSLFSLQALRRIIHCAIAIAVLYGAGTPHLFTLAQADDAPGVVLLGLIIIGASVLIALFAAVLHKLLAQAIAIQSENELTV